MKLAVVNFNGVLINNWIVNLVMTFTTNRNNIKPVLFSITFVVMILCCLHFTITAFKRAGMWHKTFFDFRPYICRCHFLSSISTIRSSGLQYSFFAMLIPTSYCFTCFCLAIFSCVYFLIFCATWLARCSMFIFSSFCFIKTINGFNFFASTTSFCYDLLRHGFFLIKKLCLEPLQDRFLCGSLYYTRVEGASQ